MGSAPGPFEDHENALKTEKKSQRVLKDPDEIEKKGCGELIRVVFRPVPHLK